MEEISVPLDAIIQAVYARSSRRHWIFLEVGDTLSSPMAACLSERTYWTQTATGFCVHHMWMRSSHSSSKAAC